MRPHLYKSLRLLTLILVSLDTYPGGAQQGNPYKTKPSAHEANKQFATQVYESNLKTFQANTNILVLPGLVADKAKRRVEVMVERSGVGRNAPCEFLLIDESSDHAYEALLISFAKPSDVHRAIQFTGTEPGESFDPDSLRFWAKGERFQIGIASSNKPLIRIERLFLDQRTGNPLREEGFMFTGSRRLLRADDPQKTFYAADEIQPKAIVSLFNSTFSVLEAPYEASKGEVYQNTTTNPDCDFAEGSLLTLVIEPVDQEGHKRVKDLSLEIGIGEAQTNSASNDAQLLSGLRFWLKDDATVLNKRPSMGSVLETLAALDRKQHDYFLTLRFDESVELRQARALARILAAMDSEKGVRIEPPVTNQIYYMSFAPESDLLDREVRSFHPWELSVEENHGKMSGKLLCVESIRKEGSSKSELEFTETNISRPQELRKEIDAAAERTRKSEQRAKPGVILVFAPPTLAHGKLMKLLAPVLPTHKTIYVYLDVPMPPIPVKK